MLADRIELSFYNFYQASVETLQSAPKHDSDGEEKVRVEQNHLQEARILANEANDLEYLDYVLHKDIHSFAAKLLDPSLEGLTVKEIKAQHSSTRTRAKAIVFAIQYGGNGSTIAANLGISLQEGERIYNAFMAKFPNLNAYWEKVKEDSIKRGYILINNITGRRRFFPELNHVYALKTRLEATVGRQPGEGDFKGLSSDFWNVYRLHKQSDTEVYQELKILIAKYFRLLSSMEKECLNTPIQGTGAEMFKLACIYVYREMIARNHWKLVKFCIPLHDELVLEAPEAVSQDYLALLLNSMTRAGSVFCKNVEIKADGHVGKTWEH